jgi:hypothetical protein
MAKKRENAHLLFFRRQVLNSGLLVERRVWRIPRSDRYPLGLKYRLILVDSAEHATILLYDNHWPKGPHVHWRAGERTYDFKGIAVLLDDFFRESAVEESRYNADKKNRN